MQELIIIDSTPAKLDLNFTEVRTRLETELAKYDVLVTAETLPGAKKLATELNQTAKAIDERCKAAIEAVSEPIQRMNEQRKELVGMCKDGRQKLLDQIKTFEDETRDKARSLLEARRAELWDSHGIEPEFRKATFEDLAILTAVTKAGNLAAKQGNELESRVLADKALQDRTRMRLLELENASFKAGLSAPLTRDHVAGFLMADDDTYAAELERIITAEIGREEEAQRRMREKLEREQREKEVVYHQARNNVVPTRDDEPGFNEAEGDLLAQAEYYDQVQQEPRAHAEAVSSDEAEQAPEPGKVRVTVAATFTPEVPEGATDVQIAAALRAAMEQAGITTLTDIVIHR